MDATWNTLSRAEWDRLAADAGAALQQDWGYGEAMAALGGRCMRGVVRDAAGRVVALAQLLTRRIGIGGVRLAGFGLCSRGPVWIDAPDVAARAEALTALRRAAPLSRPRALMFTPDVEGRPAELSAAGLRRVMTGYSTVLIDLRQDLAALRAGLQAKWRNRLRAAEGAGLKAAGGPAKPARYQWLLTEEDRQAGTKGYSRLPTDFIEAYQEARGDRGAVWLFRADAGRERAAAMLFLRHGRSATYHIGWTSAEGRRRSAHNLTLWRAIEALKAEGVERLDLGGVNTQSGAGIARFKLGSGGRCVTLCGAYL